MERMENPVVRQNFMKMMLIWSTLMSSQILFFAIVIFNKPGIFPPDFTKPFLPEGTETILVLFLLVLALSNISISVLIKRSGTKRALEDRDVSPLQTAMVVGCALCETTSVFGMVLALGFGYPYFFIWFMLGFVGIIYHCPRKQNVRLATLKK